MEPPNPLTYKRKTKIRSRVKERLSGLSAQEKNAAIRKIQERLSQTDNPNAAATRVRAQAFRAPLVQRQLQQAGFKRPEVEGYKGAQAFGRLQDRIAKASSGSFTDTPPDKLAALQARLTEQKGLRKQIGTARRTALEGVDVEKLRYGKRKRKHFSGGGGNPAGTSGASGSFTA